MSHFMDLDEYRGRALVAELATRAEMREGGKCDYCSYPVGVPIKQALIERGTQEEGNPAGASQRHIDRLKDDGVCKFPERHAGRERLSTTERTLQEQWRQFLKWGQQDWFDGTSRDAIFLDDDSYGAFEMRLQAHNIRQVAAGQLSWADILLEEVFEAMCEEDPEKLKTELIQVAAVAESWVDAIDRRSEKKA